MAQVQIVDLLSEVMQICRTAPTPLLIQAYATAARKFCGRSRWLVVSIPGATVAAQQAYSLGSDTYNEIVGIKSVSIEETSDDIHPLTEQFSIHWDPTDDDAVPDFYQYLPEAQFALHPKPNAIYPLVVSAVVQPKRGSNSLNDTLVVNWDYALQAGALQQLLKLPGTPWTDKGESMMQGNIFNSAINSARISADRGYNAGATPTNVNGPRTGVMRTGRTLL